MGIWSSLRRFSANTGRQSPERSRRSRARRAKPPKARNLRVEQFEHRLLLSINPLGGDFNGYLYDVDLATGAATNQRYTYLGDTAGLAFDQTGVLYALTADSASDPNALYQVDPTSGFPMARIGDTGLTITEGELDFDPTTGVLYGLQDTTSGLQLFRVNLTTGAGTLVGQVVATVAGEDLSAMAFDGTGACYVLDTGNDQLFEVDKATAAVLSTTPLGIDLGGGAGMAFSPETGDLYVVDGSDGTTAGTNTLYTYFPQAGSLVPVGPTGFVNGLSELEFYPEWDFGDAPAGYSTLFADDGARHLLVPNFRLGTTNDGEPDGQPSATAMGDDVNGLDDEDGVVFTSAITAGLPANVTVTASAAGWLDAWVDFDGSGSWDPGEQIFAWQPLVAGPNNLSFQAPAGAAKGDTFARFRFSSVGGLSPTGPAFDGEVEDHMVVVVRALSPNLVAVIPNVGDVIAEGTELYVAPTELLFLFNEGQILDPASVDAIEIVRSVDGTFDDGNDEVVEYGWIGLGDQPHEVITRFAETLPDDLYRITIVGSGLFPLQNTAGEPFNNGVDELIHFELDLGAQVVAVVPQPVSRQGPVLQQDRNVIEVYFNDDPLDQDAAEKHEFYQLLVTQGTATPVDDVPVNPADDPIIPASVVYDSAANKATLTFSKNLEDYGTGVFRLRIGNQYQMIQTSTMALDIVDAGPLFRLDNRTLQPVPGSALADGDTFTLSDGSGEVVFEFEDLSVGDGVSAGHVEVQFRPPDYPNPGDPGDTADQVAQAIRNAINLATRTPGLYMVAGLSTVVVTDLTPGIVVTPISDLETTESGGTAQFTVVLQSKPTDDVTIDVASDTPTEGTASPTSLTFTPINWNESQPVTVTGVNDVEALDDGPVTYTIVIGPAVSVDSHYDGINPDDVSMANVNDVHSDILITPLSGLTTTES